MAVPCRLERGATLSVGHQIPIYILLTTCSQAADAFILGCDTIAADLSIGAAVAIPKSKLSQIGRCPSGCWKHLQSHRGESQKAHPGLFYGFYKFRMTK
jgi:hypothetical protein